METGSQEDVEVKTSLHNCFFINYINNNYKIMLGSEASRLTGLIDGKGMSSNNGRQ